MRQVPRSLLVPVLALGLFAAACGDDGGSGSSSSTDSDQSTDAGGEGELVGLFGIDTGECADAGVTRGSYFVMVQPGGDLENGPFVDNADSPCGDTTFSPLEPGTDGGLITGEYQPQPEPPFDGPENNGAADLITQPTAFFGIAFAVATNEEDPQTGEATAVPLITVADDGSLSGDLSAWGVAYGGQHFNQGSPKPDGSMPGNTAGPSGTYDESSNKYVLDWSSLIVGGPFDGFTGVWHLEGTYEPSS